MSAEATAGPSSPESRRIAAAIVARIDRPLLFVHVMKTAGGTLREHLRRTRPHEELYPTPKVDAPYKANVKVGLLRDLPEERRRHIRFYAGHFPLMVREYIRPAPVTLSVLRNPVDRTLSLLKVYSTRPEFQGWPLERIYDRPFIHKWLVHNHQTRIFSVQASDNPDSFMCPFPLDAARVALAREGVASIDVLGVTERYDDFVAEVAALTGWSFERMKDFHVNRGTWEITDAFRARIAEENSLDMDLYQYACALVEANRPATDAPVTAEGRAGTGDGASVRPP
ncbi:MAG: hypothetical protein JJU45_10940 [Acidimicrobiia bacterium]|nr:hypothetical protein [Acidimicrobiia bacterium]